MNRERKKVEDELNVVRNKLREVLEQKIQLENQLNHIERVEEGRLSELENKFMMLSDDYTKIVEENKVLKRNE